MLLSWVTPVDPSPTLNVLGAGKLPPSRALCPVLREPALCPPAHAGAAQGVL